MTQHHVSHFHRYPNILIGLSSLQHSLWAAAEAVVAAQANTPKAGGFSKALTDAGKKVTDSLPNPPDISNPKGATNVPTVSKLAKNPTKVGLS